jgi:hypothetical protein
MSKWWDDRHFYHNTILSRDKNGFREQLYQIYELTGEERTEGFTQLSAELGVPQDLIEQLAENFDFDTFSNRLTARVVRLLILNSSITPEQYVSDKIGYLAGDLGRELVPLCHYRQPDAPCIDHLEKLFLERQVHANE